MTNRFKLNLIINIIFYSSIVILLYIAARFLLAYLFPVIIGFIVTVLVQRPADIISSKTRIRKGYCALALVIISYLLIIALIAFGIYKGGFYIAEAFGSDGGLFHNFTDTADKLFENLEGFADSLPVGLSDFFKRVANGIMNGVSGYVSDLAQSTAKSVPMFLTGSLVTVIASCYIARDFYGFKASLKSVLSSRILKAYALTAELFKTNILKLITGYLKLLLITFIELLIGLLILRVDYPILLASVIAVLDMLPIIGTGTVLVPWGILEIAGGNYHLGIALIILYITITIIRNVIEPRIIGKQMGLHPLIALIAVFIGLKLMGFIGIFILPLTIMLVYKMYDKGVFEILLSKNASGRV